jgi:predicted phosphodiesterase
MRIALISDIHANLFALEAVIADIDTRGDVDATYHLGDLVGYANYPNQVVTLLRERAIQGIAGNYDSTVAADYPHCGCRSESVRQEELAHVSYEYTRATITPATKQYLRALPFSLDMRPLGGHSAGPRVILVHGTPTLNTLYWTEDRSDDFCRKMDGMHFVNTGSVGRPKDHDPRAGYVVVTIGSEPLQVEFVRVEYDVDAAAHAVIEAGLPIEFAAFLQTGGASGYGVRESTE